MTRGVYTLQATNSISRDPYSDKANFPQSVLEDLQDIYHAGQSEPLIFKCTCLANNKSTYISLYEFTAEENTINLPRAVLQRLGQYENDEDIMVKIELVEKLPKGEGLTLKSMNTANTDNLSNLKFFLEHYLPTCYTSFTEGEEFSIYDSNTDQVYQFLIKSTYPSPTITITNTDLIFDLEPIDDEDSTAVMEYKEHIVKNNKMDSIIDLKRNVGDKEIVNFEIGKKILFAASEKEFTDNKIYRVSLPEEKRFKISFKVFCETEVNLVNFDLLISNDSFITSDAFIWSTINTSYETDGREFILKSDDQYLFGKDEIYFIGHYWDKPIAGVSFEINCEKESHIEPLVGENEVKCTNCGKILNKNNFFLHESFCKRNNVKCSKCNKIFLRNVPSGHWDCCDVHGMGSESRTKHNYFLHEPKTQDDLKFDCYLDKALYRATIWELKLHECRFCHLIVPKGKSTPEELILNLSNHENTVCGSRTTECYKCSKIVKQKDLQSHLKLHDINRIHKSKANQLIKCHNANCVNIINSEKPLDYNDTNAKLGICNFCYGPLHTTSYDPNYVKLMRMIERKYNLQLIKGCGNTWCKNPQCVSSGNVPRKSPREANDHVKKELMSRVPNLANNEIFDDYTEYLFCVGESITRKKILTDFFYETLEFDDESTKLVKDVYDKSWLDLAVMKFSDNKFEIKKWLKENAITIQESNS